MRPDEANPGRPTAEGPFQTPLRLAAIGCGRVFERFHLPALRRSTDWTLAAVVDPSAERRDWVQRLMPGVALAGALGELDGPDRLDAVLISTPPDTHCALASEALRRGADVLIEKPLALRASEATALVTLARGAGRRILVGYNRRFRPAYIQLRQELRDLPADGMRGIAFDLRSAPAHWGALTDFLGVEERGGGLLDDIASHQLDLLPWLVRRRVASVRAGVERRDAEAEVVRIDLRFDDGLEACCRAGHGQDSAERLEVRLAGRTLVAAQGALVSTRWAPTALVNGYLRVRTAAGSLHRRLTGAPGYTVETFERQFAAWAAVIRGAEGSDAADGSAGARCVELVEACRRSIAAGSEWVGVPVTESA
jgi:predicted dehydrogenase